MTLRDNLSSCALIRVVLGSALFWMAPVWEQQGAEQPLLGSAHFQTSIQPTLKEYCLPCHSNEKHKGDLSLEGFTTQTEVRKHPKVLQGLIEQVVNGEMPPKEKPQPSAAQREELLQWANAVLDDIAMARAGDPGPVVLRRLSNAEYTYTLRDLTGVASLNPAKEFPVDSASGEGFMNVGQSLVMSPTLVTKYLDAAKDVSQHAVLLPDGIRFSAKTTRRDWTEELLTQIRDLYDVYSDHGGGTAVNLQGIQFDTNTGGRLPLERYVKVLLMEREGRTVGEADMKGLSRRYLSTLRAALISKEPSLLMDPIRKRFEAVTTSGAGAAEVAGMMRDWQQALWRFNSVGHIGKKDGPSAWMEAVNPLVTRMEVKLKLPLPSRESGSEAVTFYLGATDAGDGNAGDAVVWQNARITAPGRPSIALADLKHTSENLDAMKVKVSATAAQSLMAAAELEGRNESVETVAKRHGVEVAILESWLHLLGMGNEQALKVEGLFTNRLSNISGYAFVKGWGSPETPNMAANASDQAVRIPGNLKGHGVVVHPSPKLATVVGWRNPMERAGQVQVQAVIQHAHPECGNGVTWSLEHRRGSTRSRLASGVSAGGKPVNAPLIQNLGVKPGDLISLVIGARDGNHSCDLTSVELNIVSQEGGKEGPVWNLSKEVSADVTASNPHADAAGHPEVWHFYVEPDRNDTLPPPIPVGSLLAQWQSETNGGVRGEIAGKVQALLKNEAPADGKSPDAQLRKEILSLSGAFFSQLIRTELPRLREPAGQVAGGKTGVWGVLNAGVMERRPKGVEAGSGSFVLHAPEMIEVRVPAELAAGAEFSAVVEMDSETGTEGSVQVHAAATKPDLGGALQASKVSNQQQTGTWTDPTPKVSVSNPILIGKGASIRSRIEAQFDRFREVIPAALCYTKIVPVDEVVTLTLFYREDGHYQRLMLDDAEKVQLNRLWDELHFVSQDALTLVDAYDQLWQFATQDADPKVFEPMRKPIYDRAATFRRQLVTTEPVHVKAVMGLAEQAYRRSLLESERQELEKLYGQLRGQELDHDSAIRTLIARVLVAPSFLYRTEQPGPGNTSTPVTSVEMASRLSYFLWSSAPDEALRAKANSAPDALQKPEIIVKEMHRMLQDPKVARMSREFAAAWLHLYDFEELGEKSERHFPTFLDLRSPMLEETLRYFTDLFQNNGSVLSILDSDHTYLNEALARHYGIEGVKGSEFRRVEQVRSKGRGGVLGQASTLSKQSGASRTSPILRGNWIAEVLLGEKLPKPPKDVPRLPEDEATEKLTVRELVEKHSSDPRCSSCHKRIDPYGFAMEEFDAIGRHRARDLGDRPIDTRVKVLDGREFQGLEGLKDYLVNQRRDAFLRQFCRKLLGYSLGRAVMLSDEPLIREMRAELKARDYRVHAALEVLVKSRQFREIRGKAFPAED